MHFEWVPCPDPDAYLDPSLSLPNSSPTPIPTPTPTPYPHAHCGPWVWGRVVTVSGHSGVPQLPAGSGVQYIRWQGIHCVCQCAVALRWHPHGVRAAAGTWWVWLVRDGDICVYEGWCVERATIKNLSSLPFLKKCWGCFVWIFFWVIKMSKNSCQLVHFKSFFEENHHRLKLELTHAICFTFWFTNCYILASWISFVTLQSVCHTQQQMQTLRGVIKIFRGRGNTHKKKKKFGGRRRIW